MDKVGFNFLGFMGNVGFDIPNFLGFVNNIGLDFLCVVGNV